MNKKRVSRRRKEPSGRVPGGFPDIAHPDNRAAYEWQCSFVYAWFLENLERLNSDDRKAAGSARDALEGLFLGFTSTLLALAKGEKDNATKQWAGIMLASIGCSVQKHDKKLCASNAAYRQEKAKIGRLRTDVLFPKPIMETVRRELQKAEHHGRTLLLLRRMCGRRWRQSANRQRIPEDYLPTVKLPEASLKFEPQWWKFLWPLFKKNNPDLLEKLKSGKFPTRGIHRHSRWSKFRKEFRSALRTVLRLLEGGVL